MYGSILDNNPRINQFSRSLWHSYFKMPLDTLSDNWYAILKKIRAYYFGCVWYEAYDFIEFVVQNFPYESKANFINGCNNSLKEEMSAYRIVDDVIAQITNEEEIAEVEQAIEKAQGPSRTHLRRALELLSDRKNPDYRNWIKESISALESLVSKILGEKGTLGQLTKKLQEEIGVHPALGKALSSLYGYTSDEDGIRHAILESKTVTFDDAKFFLVICSAFINFVNAKTAESK